MTPFSSAGNANHWPGPLCIAMMQDIGWTLAPDVGLAENVAATEALVVWPVPTEDLLHIRGTLATRQGPGTINDMHGCTVLAFPFTSVINVADLASGIYFVRCDDAGGYARFIKQ